MKMNKLILFVILTFALVACYKMPSDPDSLQDEYLNVADFTAFYYQKHGIDTNKVKVKGWIDKESYGKFLLLLKQIKDDTSVNDVSEYNGTGVYFFIYDPSFGKDKSIYIGLAPNILIDKEDLFTFFYSHSNDNFVYIYSKANYLGHFFHFPTIGLSLSDTTEINFKNPM